MAGDVKPALHLHLASPGRPKWVSISAEMLACCPIHCPGRWQTPPAISILNPLPSSAVQTGHPNVLYLSEDQGIDEQDVLIQPYSKNLDLPGLSTFQIDPLWPIRKEWWRSLFWRRQEEHFWVSRKNCPTVVLHTHKIHNVTWWIAYLKHFSILA